MGFGSGSLWVCDHYAGVSRIDPATNQVQAEVDLGSGQGDTCDALTAVDGAVWAVLLNSTATYDLGLARIDPATNTVVAMVPLAQSESGYDAIVADGQGVWTMDPDQGVFRIDPATNTVVGELSESGGAGLAVGDGSVWFVTDDGVVQRITPAS